MRRTEQLQGLRLMKFEDVYGRWYGDELSQADAAEGDAVSSGNLCQRFHVREPCDLHIALDLAGSLLVGHDAPRFLAAT